MNREPDGTVYYSAGEVEPGWVLRYDGKDRTVAGVMFRPPREGDNERQVILVYEGGITMKGDEAQGVFRVLPDTPPLAPDTPPSDALS